MDASDWCNGIADGISEIDRELSQLIRALPHEVNSPTCKQFIATAGQPSAEFAIPIITPFVIPTVLASIYCIIQHRTSWVDAVTSAIQFGGDVDTLGAIVGALSGTIHGVAGIPTKLRSDLQDSDAIHLLANRYHYLIASRLAAAKTGG